DREPGLPRVRGSSRVPAGEGGGVIDDARIAEAWSSGPKGTHCPGDDRLFDLAQGLLAPLEVERILDHTAACPDCALAPRTAAAIDDASGVERRERRVSFWSRLSATVLRPEAALAYLVLLALAIPIYRSMSPSLPVTTVRLALLEPESVSRGEG